MKCARYEKWISDLLDGRLSEAKKTDLIEHLEQCPSCESYRNQVETIRAEARKIKRIGLETKSGQEFAVRLKHELEKSQERRKRHSFWTSKWVYGTAGTVLVVALVLFLLIYLPRISEPDELFPFSPGGSISEIYSEIDTSTELEDVFNTLILASIEDMLTKEGWSETAFFSEGPLHMDKISDENLKLLENSIERSIKRGEEE